MSELRDVIRISLSTIFKKISKAEQTKNNVTDLLLNQSTIDPPHV